MPAELPNARPLRPARLLAGLFILVLAVVLFYPRKTVVLPGLYVYSGATMGTTYTVKVVDPMQDPEAVSAAIEAELDRVNARMSTYLEDSELSRFNAHAATDPFAVSPETFEVFELAQAISESSGGAFDITVGPLVNAWGFGPDAFENPPDDAEIAALLAHVGYGKLELDASTQTVRKTDAAVYCDLSAIAKGYGVDRVAMALESIGFAHYMIEVGGEVRTAGQNERGMPWQIAIEKPVESGRAIHKIVPLSGQALATSGDYRNVQEIDGSRYTHTIDPRTGRPVAHKLASASVLSDSCAKADGWATALMALGPDKAFATAEEQGLAALLLIHRDDGGFDEVATAEFDAALVAPGPANTVDAS